MFRSSTILRELVQSVAKVVFMSKHTVKLRRCILCGDVAACREMACVLFVVQTDTESKLPENGRRPKHVGTIIMCIFT